MVVNFIVIKYTLKSQKMSLSLSLTHTHTHRERERERERADWCMIKDLILIYMRKNNFSSVDVGICIQTHWLNIQKTSQ